MRKCNEDMLKKARKLRSIWLRATIAWIITDYALTIFSFLSSMLTIYFDVVNPVNRDILIILFSVLAAAFTIASFVISPRKHARAYRRAFEMINKPLLYNSHCNKCIATGIIEGEREIGKTID